MELLLEVDHGGFVRTQYIDKQVNKHNRCDSPEARLDCLWRIASNADLFDELDPSGELTETQIRYVRRWLKRQGLNLI